ncbi:MAG: protein kinase, partial [Planctomycetota bacterium]
MPMPPDERQPRDPAEQHARGANPCPVPDTTGGDEPTRITQLPARSGAGLTPMTSAGSGAIELGPTIEGYALKEELHRGGQGVVYRAIQLGTKRQVALKVLLEGPYASETTRRRFEREIELAASLRHPNIVTILDSGLSLGRYYFAMEYIEGVRLDRYLAQQRLSLYARLRLFEQICQAVNFAHQRGVLHRDLKPPNILVDAEGQPHILDFGLAKPTQGLAAGESTLAVLSQSGQLLGTVAYMSPEQAAGCADVDVRSDVYSLGVIFYEGLVGRPPYPVAGPLADVLGNIARLDPANPRSLSGRGASAVRIDDETATILLKALEKEPQRRYQSAADLARDIRRRLNGEPVEAKRASGLYVLKKALRRYRLQAATAGLILLMLVGFMITFAVLFSQERAQRRLANRAVREREAALQDARAQHAGTLLAQQELRRALVRQHIQRGDLALERADLRDARESYWKAYDVNPGPASLWALRRYYLQTPDSGAVLATFGPRTPARLSPGGELIAVCTSPDTLAVRALASGETRTWVRTPGPIWLVDVSDDGALAAAGDTWVRAWTPESLRPGVAVALDAAPRGEHPLDTLYVLDGGRSVLLIRQAAAGSAGVPARAGAGARVSLIGGERGEAVQSIQLAGALTGPPDYDPAARLLALPTTAGVELVSAGPGWLRVRTVWEGRSPARAVRFDREGLLAVLADAVYVTSAPGLDATGSWTRFVAPAERWDLFDFRGGAGTVAFATRDGRFATYRNGASVGAWRYDVNRIEQLRLALNEQSVITLDDHGTVTRWASTNAIQQQRQLSQSMPRVWAAAADGSTVLLGFERGAVLAYAPERSPAPRALLRPRVLAVGGDEVGLALSANGGRAVIRDRATVRLLDLTADRWTAFPAARGGFAAPEAVALSSDGALVALLARSRKGDRQQIALRAWAPAPERTDPGEAGAALEFVGAAIREMLFVPGRSILLLARSDGALLQFAVDPRAAAARAMPEADLLLESPAGRLAISRSGEYLAAACEDNVLRLISLARGEIRHRITLPRPVGALAFNPRDDVLLARTTDGTVHLFDPVSGELLTSWKVPVSGRPAALWLGDSADAMLLATDAGLIEYRYAEADAVIERNRAYAHEQRIERHLADADYTGAWQVAGDLTRRDPVRGQAAHFGIFEAALRRPNVPIPENWVGVITAETPAATLLRLGDAAYDGERFGLARAWLRRGVAAAQENVDAGTLWRLA